MTFIAVNIDFYLKKRCEDIQIEKVLRLEELYNDIDRIIFATLHHKDAERGIISVEELHSLIDSPKGTFTQL